MRSRVASFVAAVVMASLMIAGSAQSASAGAPTAAPAKKVDWPIKGRTVSIIVAYAAGGSNDIGARLLAPFLEKDLGTPFVVVNKVGGSGQVAWSQVALIKPDGYNVGMINLPSISLVSLDPERKATFSRKDFAPVALTAPDPNAIAVRADSPYKTLTDLINDAKAKPEKIKLAAGTILGSSHVAAVQLAQTAGVKFAMVHFDGGAPGRTALLGGHVDTIMDNASGLLKMAQGGQVRLLGITSKQESKFFPGIKTFESQGYKVYLGANQGYVLPAGTPKDIVDILAGSIKKAMDTDEMQKRLHDMGFESRYQGPAELAAFWEDTDSQVGPLIELAKKR
jgi:tripartite-type tricarboxylate transporter receptor subunit TctC